MVIIVTPTFLWVDKRVRTLISHWGYTELFMQGGEKKVHLHLYRVKTDLFGEKIYLQRLRFYDPIQQRIAIVKNFLVKLPSQQLVEEYEKKARQFKQSLRKNLLEEVQKLRMETGEGVKETLKDIAYKLLENKYVLSELKEKGKVSTTTVASVLNITSMARATTIAKIINRLWKEKNQ